MPIQIDIVTTAVNATPFIAVTGTFDAAFAVTGGVTTEDFRISGADTEFFVSGTLVGDVISFGDSSAFLTNTGNIFGADSQIRLLGTQTHIVVNTGTMEASVQLGSGAGVIANTGLMLGDVRMGGGEDVFLNALLNDPEAAGTIFGSVNMGSGDDLVQNAGQMGQVFLGTGNDVYTVVTAIEDPTDNFDNATATADMVLGGAGNDEMYGGAADDLFYGNADHDRMNGHNGNDVLIGGQGNDTIRGGNGDDRINGNSSKDNLLGGNGDDTINGGSGQDRIVGGKGDDRLVGGSGTDVFVFRGDSGSDVITDFKVDSEVIELEIVSQGSEFGAPTGWYGDADVLDFITYADGNAVLDLSGLYSTFNDLYGSDVLSNKDGIEITFLNVAEDSLTGDNFLTPQDIFPIEFYEVAL